MCFIIVLFFNIYEYFKLRVNVDVFEVRLRLDGKYKFIWNNLKVIVLLFLCFSGKIKIGWVVIVWELIISDNNWLIGLYGDCEEIMRVKIMKNELGKIWKLIWWI